MIGEQGPPHQKTFTWQLTLGELSTTGTGPNKKLARNVAAEQMMAQLPEEWKSKRAKTKKRGAGTKRPGFGSRLQSQNAPLQLPNPIVGDFAVSLKNLNLSLPPRLNFSPPRLPLPILKCQEGSVEDENQLEDKVTILKPLSKGAIPKAPCKEDVLNGKVMRPLRSVNPDQADYCGLIVAKSEDGTILGEFEFGIASLLNKKELLQEGDPVNFQVHPNPSKF